MKLGRSGIWLLGVQEDRKTDGNLETNNTKNVHSTET